MSITEKFRLDGRRAVITGGARGIGFAIAEAMLDSGAEVILADILEDRIEEAVKKLGPKSSGHVLDVTNSKEVEALAEKLGPVDILVANAGIAVVGVPFEEVDDELYLKVIDVNLHGVYYTNRAFGRHMIKAGKGAIVNIGSISGEIVNQRQDQSYYNISKAGVHHATKNFAAEWGEKGVRVNCIAPGYVESEMTAYAMKGDPVMVERWLGNTPYKRVLQPEEMATVAVFLASDASSAMTGTVVLADGGYTCW